VTLHVNAIIVFAKYPEPGKVKTRLGAQIGNEAAARLYRLFLTQTFELCQARDEAWLSYVAFEPQEREEWFREVVPGSFRLVAQTGESLGARLQAAFHNVFADGAQRVIAIGSDSPTLPREYLLQAFERLHKFDLVLGPAEDGGYYLVGLAQPRPELFEGILWSSSSVLEQTLKRAQDQALSYHLLPLWYDVDDRATLQRAAREDASGRITTCLQEHSQETPS